MTGRDVGRTLGLQHRLSWLGSPAEILYSVMSGLCSDSAAEETGCSNFWSSSRLHLLPPTSQSWGGVRSVTF